MERKQKFAVLDNEALMLRYKATKDLELKQELVMRYMYLVKKIALQMKNTYINFTQLDDIINEGVLVLMNGIDRFELDSKVKFEIYISKRLHGMILDLARKEDWLPRGVRKSIKDVAVANRKLQERLGREPSEEELLEYLGISEEKYRELMHQNVISHITSLNFMMEKGIHDAAMRQFPSENPQEQPEEAYLRKEQLDILAQGIESLKEKEQLVISLYYAEELNMTQIAEILEVTEPRISQIHAKAIEKLKKYLQKR